jgi:signal transduction histidine kinase
MTRTPETSPERRELDIMVEEIDRMAVLVSNLLQFSRSGQRQISSLLVQDEINQTLELIHNYLANRRIFVQREYAPETILIQADRQQMRQLFLNLFTNASDAMPQGGELNLRVTPDAERKRIQIVIRDTGTGIPPEIISRVMEPFYTTKAEGKGTGLGLAICRRIVEEHKGSLEISSPGENQGTVVRIELPAGSETHHPFFEE